MVWMSFKEGDHENIEVELLSKSNHANDMCLSLTIALTRAFTLVKN